MRSQKLHVACLRICVTTCDHVALHTQNGGMLTADGNSAPHVAAANLPLFPNCGSSTPHRGEKVRYRRVDDEGATFQKFQGSFQYRVRISLYPGGRIRAFCLIT
ncbi:Hypothetical protein Bbr_0364 [Bifidobacterium breve UCC2003]|nr:Hypothetical protein Bbr_0364 [Bifidobacterium breve UCC2003]AHJ24238.1 Hypothetical protein BS27_0353a [Bifidobacterium breve S27]